MKTFRLQADLCFNAISHKDAIAQLSSFFIDLDVGDSVDDYPFRGELFLKPIDDAYTVGTQLKLEF